MEGLVIQEELLRKRIEKIIENGKKTAHIKRTHGFYQSRIADLKTAWADYSKVDLDLNKAIIEAQLDKPHKHIEFDVYGKLEIKYAEYVSDLMDGLRKLTEPSNVATVSPGPSNNPGINNVIVSHDTLPRISLPKFNGDYDQWRSFHDLFVSLIHTNTKLSAVQKLHHLKTCLSGDAERLLRHIPITNEDYEHAWAKLKDRFENKRILVNHQLKVLFSQPKMNQENAKGIKSLLDTTEETLQQLKSLRVDTSSWDEILIHLLVQKLPFYTFKLWEEELGSTQDLPKFSQFKSFLTTRLKVLESIADGITSKPMTSKLPTRDKTLVHHSMQRERCPACNGKHFVCRCRKYVAMSPSSKRRIIQQANRCLNCLSGNHAVDQCTSKYRCFKCKQKHHTSLHEDGQTGQPNLAKSKTVTMNPNQVKMSYVTEPNNLIESTSVKTFTTNENSHALLATALAVATSIGGTPMVIRCLIDPGSQSSFITEAACQKLNAICTPTTVEVTGLNTSPTALSRKRTTLQLKACSGNDTIINEEFLVLKKITDLLPRQMVCRQDCAHLSDLQLADPTFWKPSKVDALLGSSLYSKILEEGIRQGKEGAPIGIKTIFGWVILGPTSTQSEKGTSTFTATIQECSLDKQLRQFWESEEIPYKTILTYEEQVCEDLYRNTYERLDNGQFQVKLPFINNQAPELGHSRSQALRRFSSLQQKFLRDPQYAQDYEKCLHEYIELGHMEQVSETNNDQPQYYLPHHAVIKESSTTKLRVVFDASCKTTNGKSLNDYLLKGPVLQPKLFATLLNWRRFKFVMNADLEKMYRMIKVHPDHRTYQRIIWKHPESKEIQDYQLTTVTFGTTAAPYLAIKTLNQLADDEEHRWPMAAQAVRSNFYVDDLLAGADTLSDALQLQTELIEMMNSGGFTLRKWSTNDPKLLDPIPIEHRELRDSRLFKEGESIKTLGILWHPIKDEFSYQIKRIQDKANITKRTILSEVASLYDPLGWLSPIIIIAKILLQRLWITGCSWDNPVDEIILSEWSKFKDELRNLTKLRIPRWVEYTRTANVQIHGFCDASCKAYAAVLYLRVNHDDGSVACTLLTSKTRVAPIKPITIPRLELNGAVMLTRLIKSTIYDMNLKDIPIYAWTDSTIVRHWIKEHPSKWKTFVANRVVEIQETVKYENWYQVPTHDNPADLASRGCTTSNLINNNLWWNGPKWLVERREKWPTTRAVAQQATLEARETRTHSFIANAEEKIYMHYSSYSKLKRIVALVQRFAHNLKHPKAKQTGFISSLELQYSESTILKLVQQEAFPEDYRQLQTYKQLRAKSKLLQLNPFIDSNKVMRVGGRLQNAHISYNRKHPIILPREHHVTQLIIDQIHADTLHGGISLVLATSRQQYWILDARRTITTRIHKCVVCAKFRKTANTQLMGNLPTSRVTISKPFSRVGIDYAGPVLVKASHCRKAKLLKAYFCVLVCMATKAIHIELVSALTSEAFIAAFKRFIARRGLCSDVYSDCGTNFVGGKTLLEKDLKHAIRSSTEDAAQYFASKAIKWHFNPPASPHFGGIWEAGVKSIKQHLRRVLRNTHCTFEEYATILAQVEACVNSRPLCYIQNDPQNMFILTPGHFLVGEALTALPEPDLTDEKIPIALRWKHIQQKVRHFWNKWSKDYLNQLQVRTKWRLKERNIEVGDVVLVKNENNPPTKWPLGVVQKIYQGSDGLIRVVDVKTTQGITKRPITKLCQLPIQRKED